MTAASWEPGVRVLCGGVGRGVPHWPRLSACPAAWQLCKSPSESAPCPSVPAPSLLQQGLALALQGCSSPGPRSPHPTHVPVEEPAVIINVVRTVLVRHLALLSILADVGWELLALGEEVDLGRGPVGSAGGPAPTGAAAKRGSLSQACSWLSGRGHGQPTHPCSSSEGGTCPGVHAKGPKLMDHHGEMEARSGAGLALTPQIYHRWCGTPACLEQGLALDLTAG